MYYGRPWRHAQYRRFYADFVGEGDLVFDVGAHVGSRTRVFASLGCRVLAIEPQPLFFALLKRIFAKNTNVLLEEAALGREEGEGTLLVSQRTPTVTSLSKDWVSQVRQDERFAWVEWDRQVRVHISTLDGLIKEHGEPAFCKIDVEGYDLQVLLGLSHPIRHLSFEYIRPAMKKSLACIDQLELLGRYIYNFTVGEGLQFVNPNWMHAAQMKNTLKNLPKSYASGDIYARLVQST